MELQGNILNKSTLHTGYNILNPISNNKRALEEKYSIFSNLIRTLFTVSEG
jgi:hypothetical protein